MFTGPHSEEGKTKISESLIGNKRSVGNTSRRGKIGLKEEENPAWKGDQAGYIAIHNWVKRHFGKAQKCEVDDSHVASRYYWANKDHNYMRIREDWIQVCPKCHKKMDGETGSCRSNDFKMAVSRGLKRAYAEDRRSNAVTDLIEE